MKITTFIFLATTMMMVTVAQSARAEWRDYKNSRFGFEFSYPADLFSPGSAPANDDGRTFETVDGEANITVWGSYNVLDQTPRSYLNWVKQEADVVDEVTYQRVKNNWVVVSGFKGHMIYYEKTIFSCGGQVMNSIALYYPVTKEKVFNPLVGRITKSLSPGIGYGSPEECPG